jgi:hypothetical protein
MYVGELKSLDIPAFEKFLKDAKVLFEKQVKRKQQVDDFCINFLSEVKRIRESKDKKKLSHRIRPSQNKYEYKEVGRLFFYGKTKLWFAMYFVEANHDKEDYTDFKVACIDTDGKTWNSYNTPIIPAYEIIEDERVDNDLRDFIVMNFDWFL